MSKSVSRSIIVLVLLLFVWGFGLPQRDANIGPIPREALINALKQLHREDPQAGIIREVRARGVDFELTQKIESELRSAGARPNLIQAVRNNFRRQPSPTPIPIPSSTPTPMPSPTPTPTLSPTPSPLQPRVWRNQSGIDLVYVPAGTFMMGSTNGAADEKPVHRVTISQSFYIGRSEVTQAQWQQVMGNNPSYFKDCGGNCPVERVSWDDAQNFINKLNERNDGFRYRLPTEAEWEYACRAGTTGDYAGNLGEMAWYVENSESKTHAIGQKRPNDWGLADMHGNVWEWCQDWYHDSYNGAHTDGSAWLSGGEQKYRVQRGGSWNYVATLQRSAYRSRNTPGNRYKDFGFRVVAVRTLFAFCSLCPSEAQL